MTFINNSKILVLADQAIFSGGNFLMTVLIARFLPVRDFGEYSAIVLMTYLAVSAISAWTTQVFQVASNRSKDYIGFIFWINLILSICTALVIKVIVITFSIDHVDAALFYGLGFVMYDLCRKILLVLEKTFEVLLLDILASILALIIIFLFMYTGTKNVSDMLLYLAGAYLISLLYFIYVVRPFKINMELSLIYFSTHIKQGKWLFFTALSQWWAGNYVVVASGVYLGAAALGALRLSQSLFGVLNILLQTFENYVLPQTAFRMKNNQEMGIAYLKEMNHKLAYVFGPVLLIVFIYAEPILTLTGGIEYHEYTFILKGLCLVYVLVFLSQPIRFFFRSVQMNNHFFYAYLISLVFGVLTSKWLITTYGLQGVITGLIASQLILMTYWTTILQLKNINIWKSSTSF